MRVTVLRLLLAALVMLVSPWPAGAQFGLPGLPRVGRVPLPVPGPGRLLHRGLPGVHFGKFHRAFGIIGAVAVGTVILGRLSRKDGAEVTRRTRVALDGDPNQEVVDTYRTTDGNKQVTITAGPTQKVSDFKGDPALQQTSDMIAESGEEQTGKDKSKAGNDAKPTSDIVKIDALPEDVQCRKVTTQMEVKSTKKKVEPAVDSKTTNISILCHTGGEWKPASI